MRLSTDRLVIRPMTDADLPAVLRILEVAETDAERIESTRRYVHAFSVMPAVLEEIHQPPYGDRAVEPRETGEVVGLAGLVPSFGPFAQLRPMETARDASVPPALNNPEVGLFYHVGPAHRRRGYAREAAQALIGFAFESLRVHRVVAETSRENAASIAVMRSVGMRIEENPLAEPPWFQVVGILEHR